jgi:small-conductance mechanosensitive channel
METVYFGNTLLRWACAAAAFGVAWIALVALRNWGAGKIASMAERLKDLPVLGLLGVLLRRTSMLLLFLLAGLVGSKFLELPIDVKALLAKIVMVGFLIQVGLWGHAIILRWVLDTRERYMESDPARVTVIGACGFLGRIALYVVVMMMGLAALEIPITPLLASVGVAGIAIGLALQNILGDLFASLSIVIDKPFLIGDFIIVDDKMGVVENIGLKTTRVRSLWGEQIVFGNNDLLASRIRNFKKMQERRVSFKFGVIYRTTHDQLKTIPTTVREIIERLRSEEMATWRKMVETKGGTTEGATLTRFDRAHFAGFGDSSLDFEVVYYVLASDYNLFMDIQQAINLEMVRRFGETGIEFAYPTRTLYMERATIERNDAA